MEIKKTRVLSFDRNSKKEFLSKIKNSKSENRIDRVLFIIGNDELNLSIDKFNEKATYTVAKEIINEQGYYLQILLYKGGKFKNYISDLSEIKNTTFIYNRNINVDYSDYDNIITYDFEESK